MQSAPQSRFILVGSGSLASELRNAAADLGERFQFLGLRNDVPDLIAAMDIFVAPSINEGMGRVLIEAAAAGVPAIASAVGGVPDIVRDGETGLLVPAKDIRAFGSAVLRLVHDPALRCRLGNTAKSHAQAFSLERMVAQIEALYESLLASRGCGSSA